MATAGALDAVASMRDEGLDGLSMGVGSVRTPDEARESIAAGRRAVGFGTWRSYTS